MSSRWRVPRCEEAIPGRPARARRVCRLAQGPVRPYRTRPLDRGHSGRRGLIRAAWRRIRQSVDEPPGTRRRAVSDTSPVSLVCCDVIGAAAVDGSVLERAFAEAIATQGVVTGTAAYVKAMVHFDQTRGWSPADVIRTLFPKDEIRAQAANLSFDRSFQTAVDRFGALPL